MPKLPGWAGQGSRRHRSGRWSKTVFPTRALRSSIRTRQGRGHRAVPAREGSPRPAARGVIALHEENCTVVHAVRPRVPRLVHLHRGPQDQAPPRRDGGKPRTSNALDRFDIDYSLCMYCGICVEVCPFDALFWSPEYEYSEPRIADLLHDKDAPRRVDGDRARLRAVRGRLRGEGQEGAETGRVAMILAATHGRPEHRVRRHRRRR